MATHLIKFSGKDEYKKAVAALAEVPETRLGLPDFKMMVTDQHLQALDRSQVPYTDLTKDAPNGSATPLQS